ncbi:hypothetical protein F4553_002024 [Allocatelliglobosispora scoriae]|uniref:Uncharacterized protein n=1 Tax=Allocatelliglobosispora scoriae TaxID=643052 RepID=A0A841BLX0_9ACTN|nr:hypothetical protein [Allocatelliglobosispora scoriae]MBB5868645.1 hypothetical protein [Allocatelliglobosispora scoriae]
MVDPTTVESAVEHGEPPAEPPAGCTDPGVWQIAHELYLAHRGPSGQPCPECGEASPCAGDDLARQGLATALGEQVTMSGYWQALAGLRRRRATAAAS